MPFPPMPTQVTCPQCQKRFVVQVHTVVDIGEEPELKEQFLRGEVNYARCPNCGTGGILSTPLIYHDPNKELLVSLIPSALGLSADEQEQMVGSLVKAVMNSLPAEKRKGYFLQPKTALSYEGLIDTILEADGISKEFLEERRGKLRLINTLLASANDEAALDRLVEEHRSELDYEFLLMLSDSIDAHRDAGDEERVKALEDLRTKLLARINLAVPSSAPQSATVDQLIDQLLGVKDEEWSLAIAMNRPRLDYSFFQTLTSRIEAAQAQGDTANVEKLTRLRERILDEIDSQNKRLREAEDRAGLLVMTLSEASDLEAAIREHLREMDQAFFAVLTRYISLAQERKDTARAEKLARIMDTALSTLEEKLPPDVRLINRLLRAEYPEGTNKVLEEHRGLLNHTFLETYDRYVADLEQHKDDDLADHLKQVRPQLVSKIEILRA